MLIVGGKKIFYNTNLYKTFKPIFGLNNNLIKLISNHLGLNDKKHLDSINKYSNLDYKFKLYKFFLKYERNLEALLRRQINRNIQFKIKINNYQGLRHKLGFPVRGQRTHSNAKTIQYLKYKKKVPRKYNKKKNKQ